MNVAVLAQGIEGVCQRLQPTLDKLTFAQRRQLVALLIDRVIVNDTQVEIRSVVPTGPKGETTPSRWRVYQFHHFGMQKH